MSEPFDYGRKRPDGQYERHPTFVEEGKPFIRPVNQAYVHDRCGVVTYMPLGIAETYAQNPTAYGRTFCCGCHDYFPIAEFLWDKEAPPRRLGE